MLVEFRGKKPCIEKPSFVAENATLIGDVRVGARVSIWFGAVVRADINAITVGQGTNIQDNVVIHVDETHPVRIGEDVTVGHGAILHGCTIGDGALIGMGATVLDGAEIGEGCIIGAGTVVTQGVKIPAGSMVLGLPGKVVRTLTEAEVAALREHSREYWELASRYAV